MDKLAKSLDIEGDVKNVISEVSGKDLESISLNSHLFLDVGLDDCVDYGVVCDILEGRYRDANVREDEMGDFSYVREVVRYIQKKLETVEQ